MSAPLELPDAIIAEAVPDDDIVLAYVTRGALARYVEGVAAKNAEFREELIACIDGLEEASSEISAAARAWREPAAAVVVPLRGQPRPGSIAKSARFWAPIALAAAFVLVAGGYHHAQTVEAERVRVEQAQKEEQLAKLAADLKAQQQAIATAQQELANAKSEEDRVQAQKKLSAAQDAERAAGRAAAGAKPRNAKAACNCQPGDPLCSCL